MKSVLIVGLGRFGRNLAKHLDALGHETMAVDVVEEQVNAIVPYVTSAQIGDCTNEEFLVSLGVRDFDVCFVTISDFQTSLEVTSLLKDLGAAMVVSRAQWDVQEKFLLRNGADAVVFPEKQMAHFASIRYTANRILDYIELDDENAIYEVPVPEAWLGKTVAQLDIRKKYAINIVAMRKNQRLCAVIAPDTVLTSEMSLMVLGDEKAMRKCFKL